MAAEVEDTANLPGNKRKLSETLAEEVDHWVESVLVEDQCNYHWTVSNYCDDERDCIETPFFTGGRKLQHLWQLQVFPRNEIDDDKFFGARLKLIDFSDQSESEVRRELKIRFSISILDSENERIAGILGSNYIGKGETLGWDKFLLTEEVDAACAMSDGKLRLLLCLCIDEDARYVPGQGIAEPRSQPLDQNRQPSVTDIDLESCRKKFRGHEGQTEEQNVDDGTDQKSWMYKAVAAYLHSDEKGDKVKNAVGKWVTANFQQDKVHDEKVGSEVTSAGKAATVVDVNHPDLEVETVVSTPRRTENAATVGGPSKMQWKHLIPEENRISAKQRDQFLEDGDISPGDLKKYALHLFLMASYYNMSGLQAMAEEQLIDSMSLEIAAICLLAGYRFNAKALEDAAAEILRCYPEVQSTPEYKLALEFEPALQDIVWPKPTAFEYYS